MINHYVPKPLGFVLIPVLFCLLSLLSCASRSVTMVHPQSGATIRCAAAGMGMMAGGAEGFVEDCLRRYGSQGYVPEGKLTPEQRADLERRCILPKAEEPSVGMGY